jgi:hypothetical protein
MARIGDPPYPLIVFRRSLKTAGDGTSYKLAPAEKQGNKKAGYQAGFFYFLWLRVKNFSNNQQPTTKITPRSF